jgi:hypothetical protein
MKFNPYPVLLTTGVLMLAIVVFAQAGPTVSLLKAKVAAVDAPSTDEARHPDTRVAAITPEPAGDDRGRTLQE